jgi:hypothetical protein
MLRIYFLQQWFNLSDPQAEDAIYDSEAMRRFARVERVLEQQFVAREGAGRAHCSGSRFLLPSGDGRKSIRIGRLPRRRPCGFGLRRSRTRENDGASACRVSGCRTTGRGQQHGGRLHREMDGRYDGNVPVQ